MLSESRRKKLEVLLRSVARQEITSADKLLHSHGHSGVNRSAAGVDARAAPLDGLAAATQPAIARPIPLAEACEGVEAASETPQGPRPYWLISRGLKEFDPAALPVAREYAKVLRGARQRFDELQASPELCHAADALPEDMLFMDLETCGLAGTPIFLVGLMFFREGELVLEQHLARDYSEEPAILHAFARRYGESGLLVTFNGKAFDLTLLNERSAFHGVEMPWTAPPHLDLLHESRRRWKGKLPNCRLQTLERHFCGRHRVGDIPGSAIPEAYHRFVRTHDARQMRDILFHNALDLLTMAQLLTILLTDCEPESP